jgi:hypothetical protein
MRHSLCRFRQHADALRYLEIERGAAAQRVAHHTLLKFSGVTCASVSRAMPPASGLTLWQHHCTFGDWRKCEMAKRRPKRPTQEVVTPDSSEATELASNQDERQEITGLAHRFWIERGCPIGTPERRLVPRRGGSQVTSFETATDCRLRLTFIVSPWRRSRSSATSGLRRPGVSVLDLLAESIPPQSDTRQSPKQPD